ncbi:MAG: NAD(P)-dependent oxidoreductase [Xanthobacteraceae bacterium]
MNSRAVLVTGASGFLGGSIVAALAGRGYAIHGCSRSGADVSSTTISHSIDLLNPPAVQDLIARVRPSHLVMAAWTTKHGDYWFDPKNEDWVRASNVLARSFYQEGGSRLVFVGSCAEYDWSDPVLARHPISEQDARGQPLSEYGRAKRRSAEQLAEIAARQGGQFAEARLFFPIGPGEDPGRFIPTIITAILCEKVANLGPANQVRDLIDVRDAGAAIVMLLDGEVTGPVNIGTGVSHCLSDVARRLGEMMGRPDLIGIGAIKARANDPPMLVAKTSRLLVDVGFRPRYSLDATLLASIDYWKMRRYNLSKSAAQTEAP